MVTTDLTGCGACGHRSPHTFMIADGLVTVRCLDCESGVCRVDAAVAPGPGAPGAD